MKLYTLVFVLGTAELATVRGAGRVPAVGEKPMIEDPITSTVGRYRVTGLIPSYAPSTAHTAMSARIAGGGLVLEESSTVHVEIERVGDWTED
ncbi:hypothetical protein AB0B88_16010 [Micromonospora haikouensis]|uniref:hypothetical protein n=1 Tax=Micromonospora haikouensis TaxID=686309 RepID=UPI0033DEE9B2